MSFGFAPLQQQQQQQPAQPQSQPQQPDIPIQSPPCSDTISTLRWSPKGSFLSATSWSNDITVWEVNMTNGQSAPRTKQTSTAPLLTHAWQADGLKIAFAGCDGKAQLWDIATNQCTQIAQHAGIITGCAFLPEVGSFVTASNDRTIKYWDPRTAQMTAQVQCSDRVVAFDAAHPVLVAVTASKDPKTNVQLYDLRRSFQQVTRLVENPLKLQVRSLSIFADRQGFAMGSIEGRVAISQFDALVAEKGNFAFKCHRQENDIYAVNSLSFHPQYNTFATCGSDGVFTFWLAHNYTHTPHQIEVIHYGEAKSEEARP